ncbi:MAG: NAD(P)-dependent oxidoreductase [Phycisphaerales bacterium]
MKVLIADKFESAGIDGIRSLGCEVAYEPGAGAEGLAVAIARHAPQVLVVRSTKVPAAALASASGLTAIIRAGAGVDNIDVPAATARGIAVANCPGTNSIAVAELVFAHLLACDRRVVDQTIEMRAGRWNKKEFTTGARGLKGSTLGVIGLGAIGQAVVKRALAFEMDIIGWDRFLSAKWAQAMGIRWGGSDREGMLAMLPECDAVTIHVALVPDTQGMANAEFFAAMKPGAIFINTARGGVVDEPAMIEAARAKKLRLGLDVHGNQPGQPQADFTPATASLPAGALTHHCGASTDQAQRAVAHETVRLVRVLKETGRLENRVNPG